MNEDNLKNFTDVELKTFSYISAIMTTLANKGIITKETYNEIHELAAGLYTQKIFEKKALEK